MRLLRTVREFLARFVSRETENRASPEPASTTVEKNNAAARRRLAREVEFLDRLDRERQSRGNSSYEKAAEERIIWSELLDLELQDIDEQLSRICHVRDQPGP